MNGVHPFRPDRQTPSQAGPAVSKGTPSSPVPPDPTSTVKGGRDRQGRFAPGNKGGPGNPYTRRCAALRQAMLEEVTPGDLKAILRALIDTARLGDLAAARLVLAYAIGKPDKAVDPDTVDLHELQPPAGLPARPPAQQYALASEILGTTVPAVEETAAADLGQATLDSLSDACKTPAARPGEQTERTASENKAQPAGTIATAAIAPTMQVKPASEPKQGKGEPGRNTREKPAATDRRKSPHGQLQPVSEIAEVVGLVQALSRQLEQGVGLGLRQELARRLTDQQRPERTAGQPSPIANRALTASPQG